MVEAVWFFFLSPSHRRISATQLPIGTSLVDSRLGEASISPHWDLDSVWFSFPHCFSIRTAVQTRWREITLRFSFLSLCKLGYLLYLFTTVACEISQVCLKASRNGINRVKIPGRVLRNWNLASMDGCHVMVKWIYCNSVCLSFNVASPSLRNKQWSIEASKTIRLVWISATWTGYELHW